MAVDFFSETIDIPDIQLDITSNWLLKVVELETFSLGDVSIIFCDDTYILSINREYLKHDYFTDIITFDYTEDKIISGDLFISVDTVQRNAIDYSSSFSNELNRVMVHGILHLIGYKDKLKKDADIMRQKEDEYLKLRELNS